MLVAVDFVGNIKNMSIGAVRAKNGDRHAGVRTNFLFCLFDSKKFIYCYYYFITLITNSFE